MPCGRLGDDARGGGGVHCKCRGGCAGTVDHSGLAAFGPPAVDPAPRLSADGRVSMGSMPQPEFKKDWKEPPRLQKTP